MLAQVSTKARHMQLCAFFVKVENCHFRMAGEGASGSAMADLFPRLVREDPAMFNWLVLCTLSYVNLVLL
jgi:hypothetical protein